MIRWMQMFTLVLCSVTASGALAQNLPPEDLPYQRATGTDQPAGERVLRDWSASSDLRPNMAQRYLPDNKAFAGAEVWQIGVDAQQLEAIAVKAFTAAGMRDVQLLAQREVNPVAVSIAATIAGTKVSAVMVSGKLGTTPAKGIGYAFHGVKAEQATVSAFMAPSNVFVALGGHVIPEVHWYLGTTEAGHDLVAEGRLPPQEAVDESSKYFSLWVAAYVVPLKGIHQNTVRMMQSWSNAMNVCSGDPACTVVSSSDGSGQWEAQIGR